MTVYGAVPSWRKPMPVHGELSRNAGACGPLSSRQTSLNDCYWIQVGTLTRSCGSDLAPALPPTMVQRGFFMPACGGAEAVRGLPVGKQKPATVAGGGFKVVAQPGIEPGTRGFSVPCSTN